MIVFWLNGGNAIGWGHCKRMLRYAKKHFSRNKQIKFWVNNDVEIVNYIENEGYKVDILETKEKLINCLKLDKPTKIYIDIKKDICYELEIIKESQVYITLFDNSTDARLLADCNIYPTPLFDKNDLDWTGYKGDVKGGWEETLLSEPILDIKNNLAQIQKKGLLITFGGADPNQITLLVMKACSELELSIPIQVIIGPSFSHCDEIKALNQQMNRRFELIENCNDLAPPIAAAKLVITAVGITIFEAQYLEVPCLVINNYETDQADEKKLSAWDTVTVLGQYKALEEHQMNAEITNIIKRGTDKWVVVIGAGFSQRPYLTQLSMNGYSILGVDQNKDSLGFSLCNDVIISSTFDAEETSKKIKQWCDKQNITPKGVLSPCTGPPYRTLQKTRAILGMPHLQLDALDFLLDKKKLRSVLNKLNASNISIIEAVEDGTKYNKIVKKPRFDGLGGKGVTIYNTHQLFDETTLNSEFVYEEHISGREMAIDAIWDGTEIVFFQAGWTLQDNATGMIIGANSIENEEVDQYKKQVKRYIEKIAKHFNFGPEYLNIDVVVDFNKQCHIIEFEFCPADACLLSPESYGYDIVKNFIAIALNKQIEKQLIYKQSASVLINFKPLDINDNEGEIKIKKVDINPYKIKYKKKLLDITNMYLLVALNNDKIEKKLKEFGIGVKWT